MTALRAPTGFLEDLPRVRIVSLSETTLFRGYSRPALVGDVVRTEACACGTDAVQRAGEDVQDAVVRHNATTAHEAWSAQRDR